MTLETLFNKVVWIQKSNLPQIKKDEAKTILSKTLEFVIEETSNQRINQLVYEEIRKKKMRELK